jgi:hypothetical protein
MAITEDILVRLRVQGQQQFASGMGVAATQTGKLGTTAQTTGKQVDATGKTAKTAGGRMQTFAGGVAKFAAATGAIYAAQQVVKDAVGNAVDLGEQMNKTAVVFRGPGARSIQDWSKGTAAALGISQRQALESAGVFGNMLVPMGIGRTQAADMSKKFVTLAADMASFNNASPEETLDALRSGLAGETEPLRKFGVFLNEARIKQEAMRQGLYDGTGELDAQTKALATAAIITRDTKDAHGDFGRTSDSLANKQRILKAQYENLTASLGQKLIPILTLLVGNLDAVLVVIVALGAAFIAWNAGAIIATASTGGLTGAVSALSAALLANPIGLIAIALIALVAAIVIAYRKCAAFRRIVDSVWGAVKKAASAVGKVLVAAFKVLWAIIRNTPLLLIIRNLGKIVAFIRGMPGKIKSAASGMFDGIKNAFRGAVNWIINGWNNLEFSLPKVKVPGPLPDIPGFTLGTPNIPTLAAGGTIASAGAAIVGERGPELVTLPQGATVTPGGVIHTHVYLNGREIATAVGNAAADRRARR